MALDGFAGLNVPVGHALLWIGWRVEVLEWEINSGDDIRKPEVQEKFNSFARDADATILAIPCESLTRIREKPIPGHSNPPVPLRDAKHVRGLPDLKESDQKKVASGNATTDWALQYAEEADGAGNDVLLENPRRSWVRQFNKCQKLVSKSHWVETEYPACAYFAARCKAQWVAGNFPEVKFIGQPKCSLLHDEGESDPYFCKQSRRWGYPSKEEAEYTPAVAFTVAVALTMSAAREGRRKLSIPRLPAAESSGSRCGWSTYDPRALRRWLMPVQARAIGLSLPED